MHTTVIKVRGYHIDLYGHVNNARYLEFLEEARWAMFESALDREEWHRRGRGLSIVNINIDYRLPATMGDVLEIRSEISRIGNKSITVAQNIFFKDTARLVAVAQVTFVVVDLGNGKALPLDAELRREIERLASGGSEQQPNS